MRVRLAREAQQELDDLRALDEMIGAGVDECLGLLAVDSDEFEPDAEAGFSIKRIQKLRESGADVFRLRFDEEVHGARIFFFNLRREIFATGIHRRDDDTYNPLKEPMTRALRYWGMRRHL
jgi:hypothetical protein